MRIKFIFWLILTLFSFISYSQDKNEIIQQRIEFIAEQMQNEEIDLTNVLEQLNYYFEHPLNLNFATSEELESLGLLNEFQIRNLLFHIQIHGKLISIYELQSLEYWDLSTIEVVIPFIKVEDKLTQIHVGLKEAIKYATYESFLRYQTIPQTKNGFMMVQDSLKMNSNSYYLGNKDHYYSRFRCSYRSNFSLAVTSEKDPGEEFFRGSQKKGFDFYSFHLFYKGGKYLKSIAIGDYQIQIGQGLNFWSGFAFNKTAEVLNIKKSAIPIKPYTSTDENRFLRGAAVELGYKRFSFVTFASSKKMDAIVKIDDSILGSEDIVTSIQMTGLHRTNLELERKDCIKEKISGVNLKYRIRSFQCGLATIYHGYDKLYTKQLQPYNQFDFRGKDLLSYSGDYNWIIRNFNFFGEISSVNSSKTLAQLHGVIIALHSRAVVSILYRNYDKAYQTFYTNGFSENSTTQNEKGIYVGWKIKLSNSLNVNSYLDFFSFPWLKFQVDQPSSGYEFLTQLNYKPNKQLEVYGRYKEKISQKNSRDSDGTLNEIENVFQRNFRVNLDFSVSASLTLKSRIEYVTINRKSNKPEQGTLLSQDIQFKSISLPIAFSLRYALFHTDSYDSRIYMYESNAQNVFSIPAYYYQGSRVYILFNYTFLKKFDVWLRFGKTVYSDRKSIGSGLEEINGNVKTDFLVQFSMKF